MRFNQHFNLAGRHALLSASKPYWLNYDEDKLEAYMASAMAAQRGTELHEFAANAIRLGIKLPKSLKTLNLYVNDAIGFRMTPEQTLYYSDNCFGTADAISFRNDVLRISDLKTGLGPAKETQLEIYSALFCLEYGFKPFELRTELRIYQNDEVRVYDVNPDDLAHIMDRIIQFDKIIDARREAML